MAAAAYYLWLERNYRILMALCIDPYRAPHRWERCALIDLWLPSNKVCIIQSQYFNL